MVINSIQKKVEELSMREELERKLQEDFLFMKQNNVDEERGLW